jgi:hypothetical protein
VSIRFHRWTSKKSLQRAWWPNRWIDSRVNDSGTKPSGSSTVNPALKNQRDLIQPTHIEMIPDHSFEPHATCLRLVEHPGIGNLALAERHFISVAGPPLSLGES